MMAVSIKFSLILAPGIATSNGYELIQSNIQYFLINLCITSKITSWNMGGGGCYLIGRGLLLLTIQ